MGELTLFNGAKYMEAPASLVERVLSMKEISAEGCWLWPEHTDRDGYGRTAYSWRGRWTDLLVHRLIYARLVGDPGSATIDHTCHKPGVCTVPPRECPHRRCFNPAHLEAVSSGVNTLRGDTRAAANAAKEYCDNGHEFTAENTYWRRSGGRRCRACNRDRMREARKAKRTGTPMLIKNPAASAAAKRRWDNFRAAS